MRWIWIDRFTAFESGKTATAVKSISEAEDIFRDHFPGVPIMPAALMLEGLAQTGGILVGEANQFREKVVLAKVPSITFTREVFAGEQVAYTADLIDLRPEGAIVRGRIEVGTERIASAEIFFAHLDPNRSSQLFGEQNFVFTGELQHLIASAKALSTNAGTK